ncbi:ArsR family transcriptional regulator [Flavobacterium enshiense DK69]|nr:ArsR family transcriptional regulator [Flavobacterium enshiense DK69]
MQVGFGCVSVMASVCTSSFFSTFSFKLLGIFVNISNKNPHLPQSRRDVSGKAMTTQPVRQNRVLFDILYFSSCLNKQIDYLCAMDNNSCIRQQADIKQINRCKDRVSELNGSFDYLSNGLELAGNNVRLKILFLLYEEKRLCVCDISDILGMTISAVSQHLRKLKDRKLIETEREAQTIFYSLTKEYEKMLKPFFKILDENKILETL